MSLAAKSLAMALDLLTIFSAASSPRLPVRRCLFGKPTEVQKYSFDAKMQHLQTQDAERFKTKWNFDILSDNNNGSDASSLNYQWVRANSDSDIPEFYRRGLRRSRKSRPVVKCIGKALTFDEDSTSSIDEPCKPVPFDVSAVELFLGLRIPMDNEVRSTSSPSLSSDCVVSGTRTPTQSPMECDSENVRPSVRRQLRMTGKLTRQTPLNYLDTTITLNINKLKSFIVDALT